MVECFSDIAASNNCIGVDSSTMEAFLPAQQYLYHFRDAAGAFVPDHSWARSARHHRSLAPEWCFPGSHGVASLSQSRHPAAVPGPVGGSRIDQLASRARPPADETVAAPQASAAHHLRPGLHGADLVRASGASPHRLQSAQTRPSFLSSLDLL